MRKRAPCSRSRSNGRARRTASCPQKSNIGAMLEVPSLAEMLDQLLPRVDFLSIGTNDLTQFLFAADRSEPRLAQRYDWLSPAILRFLKRVLDAARRGERAGSHLRRDGRPAARSDGAGRHRSGEFLDHPGRRRAGQGDGPLARRGRGQGPPRPAPRPAAQGHAQGFDRLGEATFGDNRLGGG